MDKEFTASNFIPEKLLDITCILERDEKHHSYKIIRHVALIETSPFQKFTGKCRSTGELTRI